MFAKVIIEIMELRLPRCSYSECKVRTFTGVVQEEHQARVLAEQPQAWIADGERGGTCKATQVTIQIAASTLHANQKATTRTHDVTALRGWRDVE